MSRLFSFFEDRPKLSILKDFPIWKGHKKSGQQHHGTRKSSADTQQRAALQRSKSEKDIISVSAHVNKYYAKHRRRGDQESAKTEEEKLEDQESQQV